MVQYVSRKRWLLNLPKHYCPKPFCQCWRPRHPNLIKDCTCGEEIDLKDWIWEHPQSNTLSKAVVSADGTTITFHPYYSSGTMLVRGNKPLQHDHHHYWEVKMLTDTYGTEIMVGIGSHKVEVAHVNFKQAPTLGQDRESYGMSYRGTVKHDLMSARDSVGFCRGTIIGVRVDLWAGTLEFYLNRKPQGVVFYNLRRHKELYPMVCSTASQSCMRLTYASSWPASLLVHAARALTPAQRDNLPPGLRNKLRTHFWLALPTDGPEPKEKKRAEKKQGKSSKALPKTGADSPQAGPSSIRRLVRLNKCCSRPTTAFRY